MPEFDVESMIDTTLAAPEWLHFGAGNIFRAFLACNLQKLLETGAAKTGISVAESYDGEIIDKIYKPYDNLSMAISMKVDGSFDKMVTASVAESLAADITRPDDWARLTQIVESDSLKMVSFTITEKGYSITDRNGDYLGIIKQDIQNGPQKPVHVISIVASLLLKRFEAGATPIAVVSMDNCNKNGEKLRNSVLAVAKEWHNAGFVDDKFMDYICDESVVAFPWSMIDKITPRPSEKVQQHLLGLGIDDAQILVTNKHTYIGNFVNAEVTQYLVVEDNFPNGRFPLEQTRGIIFTDRDTVNRIETMKVTTCLNPLHTALAVLGCLLQYTLIADEMKDTELKKLAHMIGYKEGLPVVVDPGVINPKAFIDEVVEQRFVNPYIPDTPQRIATDTSQKVAIRFGETIKSHVESEELDAKDLIGIPLAIAGWFRYLLAVDDEGQPFELSPDPMLEVLLPQLEGIKLGDRNVSIKHLIENEKLFGLDLYEAGLVDKINGMFNEMIRGKGAVRATLVKYL